jgi:hypothetical protein
MCSVLVTRYAGAVVARQRPFAVTVAVALALPAMLVAIASSDFAERFADIAKIQLDMLALRPNFVTDAERDLLSARLYIWSQYLTAFRDANLAQQLVGFGPESWRGVFRLYAHNTFVSYLYEFGYLGLGAFLLFWISNIVFGLRIREAEPRLLVFAAYAGFTILNLATMPVWQIEGLIFFAILNGTAMHYALRGANATGPATHEDKASQNRGPYAGAI